MKKVNITVTLREAQLVHELLVLRACELRNEVVYMDKHEIKEYNIIEPLIEQIQCTLDLEGVICY